jgi:hypothetical protein
VCPAIAVAPCPAPAPDARTAVMTVRMFEAEGSDIL